MIELAMNTSTAARRIGIHRDMMGTIGTSLRPGGRGCPALPEARRASRAHRLSKRDDAVKGRWSAL